MSKKIMSSEAASKTQQYLDDFTFIDVSGAKALLRKEDRTEVITDRHALALFFTSVSNHPGMAKFVVADVLFDKPAPDDKELKAALLKVDKIILPHTFNQGKIIKSIFDSIPSAYSGYNQSSGLFSYDGFLKTEVVHPEAGLSLPAKLYEALHGPVSNAGAGLVRMNGHYRMDYFVPEMRLVTADVIRPDGHSIAFDLHTINTLLAANEKEVAEAFFKNRIIIIGDFENDTHNTVAGNMPGALILANIYLALREGDNRVTAWWLLYIFFSFLLLSWLLFYPELFRKEKQSIEFAGKLKNSFAGKILKWSVGLLAISAGSYLLFGIHLDILFLDVVIIATQFIIKKWSFLK